MKMICRLLCLIALEIVIFATPTPSHAWDKKAMNAHIDQTNFMVNSGCSGTLIDAEKRYILTANHCVEDQYETIEKEEIDDKGIIKKNKIRRLRDGNVSQYDFQDGDTVRTVVYKVRLVAVDSDRDLALMQIAAKIPNKTSSLLACTLPERGDAAFVVGNPMGTLYSSVTRGIVSSVNRNYGIINFDGNERAKQALLQVSSGIVGGNSGGAVYDDNGLMIGVPVVANRANEVIGFAVPIDVIAAFLKENNAGDIPAVAHCQTP